ncbi:MAG: AAA family ATPase [Chthoniobacterales bacterium]
MTTATTPKLLARKPKPVQQGHFKALIFGPSGVGKTWISLDFPAPYYIDCEGGADLAHYQAKLAAAGGAYMGPEGGSLDFATVIAQVKALASQKHPYKTVIFDSITKLFQTAIANEAERLGDKDAFGASKKPAVAAMRSLIMNIMKLGMNVIFIAHEATEWGLDPKTGQRTEVGKIADCWEKLIYELDLTVWVQKRGASRVAIVRKSRLTGFPEGETFALDYAEFGERYGKDFIEAEVVPLSLATPEEVAEVKRLLEIIKVSEEEIAKGFTKASVDSWEEMTSEQIQKWTAYLKKKLG